MRVIKVLFWSRGGKGAQKGELLVQTKIYDAKTTVLKLQ